MTEESQKKGQSDGTSGASAAYYSIDQRSKRYLGGWRASCRDDLGLDDRAVYMPEGHIKKSSQVAYFQIGTNKCAMQRAQPSKKRKNAASGALIEAEVAWNSSGIRHRLG